MDWALAAIGVAVVVFWFIKGFLNSAQKRRDNELQAYYDSLQQNHDADDLLSDYERVQHVQDRFND